MARELEKRHSLSSAGATAQPIEPVMRIPQVAPLDGGGSIQRREPVLKPPARTQASPDTLVPARPRSVEIDFARLASRGLLIPAASQSRLANELRVIKRPLINNCVRKSGEVVNNSRRIMITSALPGEGKSYIATNLAMSIATERDNTVLLVEADPGRPALAQLFGVSPGKGLMDLLVDPKLNVADVMINTNVSRLSFIPVGTPQEHATELLASGAMERLVEQLASRYPDRIVIFDSAPLLAAPEARVLAGHMGQIVLVVEAEKTTHSATQQALAAVESCPLVMLVLNKAAARQEQAYYYAG